MPRLLLEIEREVFMFMSKRYAPHTAQIYATSTKPACPAGVHLPAYIIHREPANNQQNSVRREQFWSDNMDDNRETSTDVVFEYTGDGCSVPKDVISVRFTEGLQKIGDEAFYKCTLLESIKLPSTLVEIGDSAFRDCHNLREVVFNDGLQKVGFRAFGDCSSLENVTLPSTIVEIGTNLNEFVCVRRINIRLKYTDLL